MIRKIFLRYNQAQKITAADIAILTVGLVIFATISLWTIGKSSVWFDEAFGAYLINFNFFDVAAYTAADVHPPFYYWLLKSWSMLFGTTELALRSMSVFFTGIAIVFGYLLTHRLFGKKAASLSLLFMVLAPILVRYSQEMRMYAIVAAIALAATYVLTFAIHTKKRLPWVIYGILVSLGMWTHYFSVIIWISHWIWRAYIVRQSLGSNVKKFTKLFFSRQWILAHVVAVGLYLPWLPFFVHQVTDVQVNGFWIPPVTPTTIPNFLTNVIYYQDQENVTSWAALVFLAIFIGMVSLAVLIYRTLSVKQKQAYMLIIALAFVPIVLLFVLSMPPLRSSFVDRYLVPSTVGISLFFGVTLALSGKMLRPKQQALAAVIVASALVVGVANVYHFGNYNRTLHSSNNTRQIVEAVARKSTYGQPIIADSPWLFYEAVFYSTTQHPVYFIDANTQYRYGSLNMLRYNDQHKIKNLTVFSREHPIVWYLGRPGDHNLNAPSKSWVQIQQVQINDSISDKPSYKAVQYKTN